MRYIENGEKAYQSGNYTEAVTLYEKGFFSYGEIDAGEKLATLYQEGKAMPRGGDSFFTAMLLWYATKEENAASAYHLGEILAKNTESAEAREEGQRLMTKAAEMGYGASYASMAFLAFSKGQYETAIAYFEKCDGLADSPELSEKYLECFEHMQGELSEFTWTIGRDYVERFESRLANHLSVLYLLFSRSCNYPDLMPMERKIQLGEKLVIDCRQHQYGLELIEAMRNASLSDLEQRQFAVMTSCEESGNPDIYKLLAKAYFEGRGTTRNVDQALRYAKMAQDGGREMNSLFGAASYEKGNYAEAKTLFDQGVDRGDYGYSVCRHRNELKLFFLDYPNAKYTTEWAKNDEALKRVHVILTLRPLDILRMIEPSIGSRALNKDEIWLDMLGYHAGLVLEQNNKQVVDLYIQGLRGEGIYPVCYYFAFMAMNAMHTYSRETIYEVLERGVDEECPECMLCYGDAQKEIFRFSEALDYYIMAYEAGYLGAAKNVSEMYLKKNDKKKAAEWAAKIP